MNTVLYYGNFKKYLLSCNLCDFIGFLIIVCPLVVFFLFDFPRAVSPEDIIFDDYMITY